MLFLYIILGILAIYLILILVAPKEYSVSRSLVIERPVAEVYDYLKYLKNQDHWSPWKKRDPEMKQTFTGSDGTVGFISHWDSDHKQVGSGEQEISKLDENRRIETDIRFLKPWKSESTGFFDVVDEGSNTTKVVWGFSGKHKVPVNVMMMFMNMDKLVGKDFDEGLNDLKTLLEKNR